MKNQLSIFDLAPDPTPIVSQKPFWLSPEGIKVIDKKPIEKPYYFKDPEKIIKIESHQKLEKHQKPESEKLDFWAIDNNLSLVFEDTYLTDGFYCLIQVYERYSSYYKVINYKLGNYRCYFNLASQVLNEKSFESSDKCLFDAREYIKYRLEHMLDMCAVSKGEKEEIRQFLKYLES